MRKNDSIKRLLILCLSFLGIVIATGMYAYTWIFQYHQRYVYNVKLYFWGHIMMVFVYFILLFFFNTISICSSSMLMYFEMDLIKSCFMRFNVCGEQLILSEINNIFKRSLAMLLDFFFLNILNFFIIKNISELFLFFTIF